MIIQYKSVHSRDIPQSSEGLKGVRRKPEDCKSCEDLLSRKIPFSKNYTEIVQWQQAQFSVQLNMCG